MVPQSSSKAWAVVVHPMALWQLKVCKPSTRKLFLQLLKLCRLNRYWTCKRMRRIQPACTRWCERFSSLRLSQLQKEKKMLRCRTTKTMLKLNLFQKQYGIGSKKLYNISFIFLTLKKTSGRKIVQIFTINCALIYWRHLPALLLYNDFACRVRPQSLGGSGQVGNI